jgi:hydroxymethylbilane synthase
MERQLVIGSRGSRLALAQSTIIKDQLSAASPGVSIEIQIIKTSGDVKNDPLSIIGGKGVFTKELEEALLDRRIDLAVHSLKDLPTVIPNDLILSAIGEREDPRDALVLAGGATSASIRSLPPGAVVGTSSPRRAAQLRYLRPDVIIKELRGNIDTRLRKLDEGEYHALVLAAAGLRRLNLENRISHLISTDEMLPAVSQGAIGLETRADDHFANAMAANADHPHTRLACTAERAFLRALGGGCQLPIAGHAVVSGDQISIDGLVANPEGNGLVREQLSGASSQAAQIGAELGARLLERGARSLLGTASS